VAGILHASREGEAETDHYLISLQVP
jgi:hypothetical protein